MKKTILITGAQGLIGSYLHGAFADKYHQDA
jgi:nucleoside-diphosphate-sugar epimerase